LGHVGCLIDERDDQVAIAAGKGLQESDAGIFQTLTNQDALVRRRWRGIIAIDFYEHGIV
jgi:hypothetical protein